MRFNEALLFHFMKDCIKKAVWTVVFLIVLDGCGRRQEEALKEERLAVYSDVLDQLMMDDYYRLCAGNELIEKIHDDYINGAINELTYLSVADSLKEAVRKGNPKCVLVYHNEIGNILPTRKISDDMKASMREGLTDKFFTDHFSDVSIESVLDSVSVTARLSAKDLSVGYLEILPYGEKNGQPGDAVGVIGFSKIYFNKTLDKAILYYEFFCGEKCASGKMVFVEKGHDQWKIKGQKRVWIT